MKLITGIDIGKMCLYSNNIEPHVCSEHLKSILNKYALWRFLDIPGALMVMLYESVLFKQYRFRSNFRYIQYISTTRELSEWTNDIVTVDGVLDL